MFVLIPYEVRTLTGRVPWANYLLVAANVICFLLLLSDRIPASWLYQMILDSWYLKPLIGYQFLHGGWGHLIGNMIFLWVFGNALAGVMNNFVYLALYLALGVLAGAVHLLMDGGAVIGASGAISGLIGFYVAVYPVNKIHCFYLIIFRWGTFDAPGFLLIIAWFLLNLANAFASHSHIAYWAHIGGAVSGFLLGLLLLKLRVVDIGDYDNPTTLDYFSGRAASM